MSYYKGTKQQCEDYVEMVNQNEGFEGATSSWFIPINFGLFYYVMKHENYQSLMIEVDNLPNE